MAQVAGLNPWLTMWSQPKSTVRALVHSKSSYGVLCLAAIYALQSFFFYSNWWSLGLHTHFYLVLFFGVVLSPLLGFIWLYYMGLIFHFTGHWLKGQASTSDLRVAIAWSKIPYVIGLLMWFTLIFLNLDYAFIQDAGGPSSIFIYFISFVLCIWSSILLIQGIREVQQFTLGRSIVNFALAWFVSFTIFFLFFSFLRYIYITII